MPCFSKWIRQALRSFWANSADRMFLRSAERMRAVTTSGLRRERDYFLTAGGAAAGAAAAGAGAKAVSTLLIIASVMSIPGSA